eukprot:4132365-Amphidinium_carterae.1
MMGDAWHTIVYGTTSTHNPICISSLGMPRQSFEFVIRRVDKAQTCDLKLQQEGAKQTIEHIANRTTTIAHKPHVKEERNC